MYNQKTNATQQAINFENTMQHTTKKYMELLNNENFTLQDYKKMIETLETAKKEISNIIFNMKIIAACAE